MLLGVIPSAAATYEVFVFVFVFVVVVVVWVAFGIDILAADTRAGSSELPELVKNREHWKTIVDSARARSTE